nr:uncharacterized protein LOC115256230 [Aedes albopictus]
MTFQFSQQENMSSRIVQPIIPSSSIIGTVNAQQDSTVVSARTNHGLNVNATADNSVLPTAGTPQSKRNSTSYVISGSHASTPAPHHNQAPHAEIKNYANSENSAPHQLTVPIVMGSDGKQYAQLDGCYYPITENSNETVYEPMSPIIKQDEVDLGVDDDLNMSDSAQALDEPDCSTISSELRKINERLGVVEQNLSMLTTEVRKISERMGAQEGLMSRLTEFMANFNKLMSTKQSIDISNRYEEDFSEFDNMQIIDSDQAFRTFEQGLGNSNYSGKFFRYLHSIYSLNGKRDSGPLFRTIIRKFLAPNVFLPYSWMGNKRTKPGTTSDSGQNQNFQESFPNFIRLMHQVLQAADCSSTREQNEILFKNLLRYKMLEAKRFEGGNGERRASSSRKHPKKQKAENQVSEDLNLIEPSEKPSPVVEELLMEQSDSSDNSGESTE